MAEYVKKVRAPVRICLPGQDPLDGQLALGPQSQRRQGPETILELLNAPQRVIPFIMPSHSAVLLVTRLNIDWVLASNEVDPTLVCPQSYIVTQEELVELSFNDGRIIDGMIQMEMPEGMNRASDFMNCTEDFFPLRTRFGIIIVNKARVRDTRVHEPSPLPTTR